MLQGGNIYRIVSDQLGSVRLVVNIDDSSDVLFAANYSAFGILEVLVGVSDVVPFGFAGGVFDEATGLVRFGARDYDPGVGRWTAKDPIGFEGGDSDLYAYVGNNPANRTDPTGLTVYACQQYNRDWAHYWWVWHGFSHAYLQTDTYGCGLYPSSRWPGDPGRILDDSDETGTCQEIPDVDEDCVNSYAELGKYWGSYPFDDCGTFVADVLNSCRNYRPTYSGAGGTAPDPGPAPYPPGGF
jgi:RHS repeat-associated protein